MIGGERDHAAVTHCWRLTLIRPGRQPRPAGGGCRALRLRLFNVVGGFLVTDRCWPCPTAKRSRLMGELTTSNWAPLLLLALSLKGLAKDSAPARTAQPVLAALALAPWRWFGFLLAPSRGWRAGPGCWEGLAVGGGPRWPLLAFRVAMTSMPETVALVQRAAAERLLLAGRPRRHAAARRPSTCWVRLGELGVVLVGRNLQRFAGSAVGKAQGRASARRAGRFRPQPSHQYFLDAVACLI